MTVIITLLTKTCTVHCTDSFVTARKTDGIGYDYIQTERSKIIAVEKYRAAFSFFHLALMPAVNPQWDTFKFLQSQALSPDKPDTAEEFAIQTRDLLTRDAIEYCKLANMGIGIHFTAYENVGGYQIPEMFYISNISGIDPVTGFYAGVNDHFSMGRHAFHTISQQPVIEDHRNIEFRMAVKSHLDSGFPIWFNNGDPLLFNVAADALTVMTTTLSSRHILNDANNPVDFYSRLALQPVQIVSKLQKEFCKANTSVVGGKCHNLTITPAGEFTSFTGKSDIGGF